MLPARRIVLVGLCSICPTDDMVRCSSRSKLPREAAPANEANASRMLTAEEAPPSLPASLAAAQLAALRMS